MNSVSNLSGLEAFQNTRYRPFTQTLLGRLLMLFVLRPAAPRATQ